MLIGIEKLREKTLETKKKETCQCQFIFNNASIE